MDSRSERVGYWLFVGHLVAICELGLSNVLLGLIGIWVLIFRRSLDWNRLSGSPLRAPLSCYVAGYVASVVFSFDIASSAVELKSLTSLATLVLGIVIVNGEHDTRRLLEAVTTMILVLAVIGIGQFYFTDYGPISRRIPSLFSHYMTFSGVLLFGVFLVLGKLLQQAGWKKIHLWIAFGILVFTLSLTLTRGAWIAASFVIIAALLLSARRSLASRAAVGGVIVATLFAVVVVAPESWKQRARSIVDPTDESNYDRICMIRAGLDMVEQKPLFGIGPGMVEYRYAIYRDPTAPRMSVKHLHNTFVQMAAERGLVSLGAYLWLMAAVMLMAWRGYRREGGLAGDRSDLYVMVMLAIVGFNLAGLFEANWRDTEIQRLMLALLVVPHALDAERKDGASEARSPGSD